MLLHSAKKPAKKTLNSLKKSDGQQMTELVLRLKKEELFDPHILFPHSELNSIIYDSVDAFVSKYGGSDIKLLIYSETISPMMQDVFREVYQMHYMDELQKTVRLLRRHKIRILFLMLISVCTFLFSSYLNSILPSETVMSYVIANISCFCLWETGYITFDTRDDVAEKKRIIQAMNAKIEFS